MNPKLMKTAKSLVKTHKDTFLRFIVVGGIATIINYGIFFLLYHYEHWHYILSAGIGYMTGVVFAFWFNKTFTFRSESKRYTWEAGRFFLVYAITLCIGLGILSGLVHLGIPPLLANVFSIGCTTIMNYLGSKYIAFS